MTDISRIDLKVGFVVAQDPAGGGLYQYSTAALQALDDLAEMGEISSLVIFAADPSAVDSRRPVVRREPTEGVRRAVVQAKGMLRRQPAFSWLVTLRRLLRTRRLNSGALREARERADLERWYRKHDVDLMFYPAPSPHGFESGVPYIMAIHDLQHRLQPEFPEVSADGEWQMREYVFGNGAIKAAVVLVDSEIGKEDLLAAYGGEGLDSNAVVVAPFIPSVRDSDEPAIAAPGEPPPRPYLFYPAQFWPHKNHLRVVEALGLLVDRGHDLHVVFTGSHGGSLRTRNFRAVMRRAASLNLSDRVHYLGYVADNHLPELYSHAAGLIMPTFFGPTNIPVLEAWEFGCPVITSDIRGIREQVGDGGVLVDPRSVKDIAAGIELVLGDPELRRRIVKAGKGRLDSYTREDFRDRIAYALERARERADIE